jgi:hypothetical protein
MKYLMASMNTSGKVRIIFCVGFIVSYLKVGYDCFLPYPFQLFNHSIIQRYAV